MFQIRSEPKTTAMWVLNLSVWTHLLLFLDFKIFKHINRSETGSSFRMSVDGAKVLLLSELNDSSAVAEAILMETDEPLPKQENNNIDSYMSSLTLSATSEYVYDMYRIDLGKFSETDIKGSMAGIVTYEQELVNESECSESDFFEDEYDSNGNDIIRL